MKILLLVILMNLMVNGYLNNPLKHHRLISSSTSSTSSISSLASLPSLHEVHNPLLQYNFLLNNSDDDIKSQLFPFQLSVVIIIFSIFGILRYKISTASNIKLKVVSLQNEVKTMKTSILSNSDSNITTNDINEKEMLISNLILEFDSVKTFFKFQQFQLNVPVAALGGDIIEVNDSKNQIRKSDDSVNSTVLVSSITQLFRLVIGLVVLYGLCFILYLLNSPNDILQSNSIN